MAGEGGVLYGRTDDACGEHDSAFPPPCRLGMVKA
jgi:hypothetical protein